MVFDESYCISYSAFIHHLQISIEPEDDSSSRKQLQFNTTDIQFRQIFWISNDGPSPQNELFEFTAYVPKTDLLTLELERELYRYALALWLCRIGAKYVAEFRPTEASTSSRGGDSALLKSVPSCQRYNGQRFSTNGRLKVPANSGEMFSCSTVSCHIIDCKIAPFSLGSGHSIPFTLKMIFRYDIKLRMPFSHSHYQVGKWQKCNMLIWWPSQNC